jgi:excisionase family DNA binding protein
MAIDAQFYTLKQAEEFLAERGITVKERTLRKWIQLGKLQAHRPGMRTWYVKEEELDRVLTEGVEAEQQAAA